MAARCKGLCTLYYSAYIIVPLAYKPRYEKGIRLCSTCEVHYSEDFKSNICPCCHLLLRANARSNIQRKRRNTHAKRVR